MKLKVAMFTSALTLTSAPALAHTATLAENSSLLSGLLHPLTGLDHLLAMLAVGAWAALQKDTQRLQIPATFVLMLMAGFALGLSTLSLPLVESGIATSVLILGLLVMTSARLPLAATLGLTSIFAVLHGYAHGAEAHVASLASFAVGFLSTSAALHFIGGAMTHTLKTSIPMLAKLAGFAIAATGAGLLAV